MQPTVSYQQLYDSYYIKNESIKTISEKYNLKIVTIKNWLKYYNIPSKSKKFQDLTTHKYYKWTVLERAENGKHKTTRWKCRCSCGNIGYVAASDLKSGNHKSCGKCNWHIFIQDSWWSEIQKQAKKRNKEFNLTKDYLYQIWKNQNGKCAISGMDMFMPIAARAQRGPKCTASLDRIDNTKGYIEGNVQWVRKEVNKMRREYSVNDYINICNKVSEYQNAKKTNSN